MAAYISHTRVCLPAPVYVDVLPNECPVSILSLLVADFYSV